MIKIYVDGSSCGNPGTGGSGVVVYDTVHNELLGAWEMYHSYITNNRAELLALLHALELTKEEYKEEFCEIYSDSAYCVNMCHTWIHNWAVNGWINSKKQQVENYDVVKKIYKYVGQNEPNFEIVKIPGHSGIIGNELADALATHNHKKFQSIIKEHNIKRDMDERLVDPFALVY